MEAVALTPKRELRTLAFEQHALLIDGQPVLVAGTSSRGAILAESAFAPRPLTQQDTAHVTSASGQCRGEMLFDLTLAPGGRQTFGWFCPMGGAASLGFCRTLAVEEVFARVETAAAPGK